MKFGFAIVFALFAVLVIAAVQGAPQKHEEQPPRPKVAGFMSNHYKGLVAIAQKGFNTDRKAACGSSTPASTTTAAASGK